MEDTFFVCQLGGEEPAADGDYLVFEHETDYRPRDWVHHPADALVDHFSMRNYVVAPVLPVCTGREGWV